MDWTLTAASRRTLAPDDLPAVAALVAACDVAVLGRPDFADADLLADLRRDDLEAYGWFDGDALVGYGWAARLGDSARVDIDAYVLPDRDPRLGVGILAFLEERASRLAADAGHGEAVLDIGVYRQDDTSRAWLVERGFETPTSFVRMRIDFDGPVDLPATPVQVRRPEGSEADLRLAHRIADASFAEHYSHADTPFESWAERLTERGPDFATVWLGELAGEAVGVLVGTNQFDADENAGYVRTLGTLASARGCGVGTALVRAYFAAAQQAGRSAVLLHVDTGNVTGALRLYESVGMRPVLTIDAWTKRLPLGAGRGVTPASAAQAPATG